MASACNAEPFGAGGGGSTELPYVPSAEGAPPVIYLDLNVWGAGGDIGERFKDVQMVYTIGGTEPAQRVAGRVVQAAPKRIRYAFTLKPYAGATRGRLNYHFEKFFDGHRSVTLGLQQIDVVIS